MPYILCKYYLVKHLQLAAIYDNSLFSLTQLTSHHSGRKIKWDSLNLREILNVTIHSACFDLLLLVDET